MINMFEDFENIKPKPKIIDLDPLSIEELEERIILHTEEIERMKAAIIKKKASLDLAQAVFGKPKT